MDEPIVTPVDMPPAAEPSEAPSTVGRDDDPFAGSLEARIAASREELELETAQRFPVPGFTTTFEVDFQVLGWKRLRQIADKHKRVGDPAERELRVAADTLLAATVGFHAVINSDGDTQEAPGITWRRLARARDPQLTPEATPRAELIRLLGGTSPALATSRIVLMYGDYMDWLKTGNAEIDSKLERDS